MPVYNTPLSWLMECVQSIVIQTFQDWELCICDNGCAESCSNLLKGLAVLYDPKIKLIRLETNQGGYAGVNAALDIASGEYIGLMDSDDVLVSNALEEISKVLSTDQGPSPTIVYTDEMLIDPESKDILPFFKPDFSRDLLLRLHYFGHMTLYREYLIKELRLKHAGGSYDYDLALRAVSKVNADEIVHIPQLLYKYRSHSESTSSKTKESCIYGGLHSLQTYLNEKHLGCTAILDPPFYGIISPDGSKHKFNGKIKPYGGYETWLLPEIFEKE